MYVVVFTVDGSNGVPSVYGPFDDIESADAWGTKDANPGEKFYVRPLTTAIPHDAPACTYHRPVQHRDAKPPWCRYCGLTEDYQTPKSMLERNRT